jgi:hypothetical protein
MAQKAGVLTTALPAMGIQALKNAYTGNPDSDVLDYQKSKFVTPWEQIAQDNAIKPATEELTGPGMAGNVAGALTGMVPDMVMGGPGKKVVEAGHTIIQNALAKFAAQVPSAANMAATQGFSTSNQLQAGGVPKDVAEKAALSSYPTNVAGFAFPLAAAGKLLPRTVQGAGANVAMDVPATMQENQVLRDAGQGSHAQDILDPTRLGTAGGLGGVLAAVLGQRAPAVRTTRDTGGYNDVHDISGNMRPGSGATTAEQIFKMLVPEQDIATRNAARKSTTDTFKGGQDPVIRRDSVVADHAGQELHPLGEAPVPATDKTGTVFTKPEDLAVSRQAGGDSVRSAYIRAGLNPDSQANAMGRKSLSPDDAEAARTLKAQLDPEQVALVHHYMGVPPDELAQHGPNNQRRLLARAMEAKAADDTRAGQGTLQTTFEGGEGQTSPASKPNVPGDRMESRSIYEDQGARMAQDQEAADLTTLREKAAGGDKGAQATLRQKEVVAGKAAKQKTVLIDQLQGLRQQREAVANGNEFKTLKRTRETGGTLDAKQQKKLDSYESQHAKLGDSIFKLESKIYSVGEKSDLASVSASGKGDRPFRGFSKEEGEHAGMFEAKAREKHAAEERASIDELEAEWAAREKQRTERNPRAPDQPQPKQTGDGTPDAAPVRDQAFDTNPDGFVVSTNGNPIHFGHQRDAGWWILKKGNKQSARQVFEISNHPSGKGFTVRETHKTDGAGPGPKQEGAGPKQESAGEGGAVAVRGESPRPEPGVKQEAPAPKEEPKPAPKQKKTSEPRVRAQPARDLLQMIRSWGGIDPMYRQGITGQPKGHGTIFREGGQDLGDIATRMYEDHFLDQTHMEDPATHPADHASALIRRALNGEEILNANDLAEQSARGEKADYKQHLVDEISAKGIKTKRFPDFHTVEELQAAIADHNAKVEARIDALDVELAAALKEAEAVIGDRVSDVIKPHDGVKDLEAHYRDNIAALKRAIEDEHAYNEDTATRQVDAREEGGSDRPDGAQDGAQGAERRPGEEDGRPEFGLKEQSEGELKAKADAEAKANADKESAQRKAEADVKKEAAKKETAEREARVLAEREAAKKAEVDAAAKEFELGQDPPKPVETKVSKDEAAGQGDLLSGDGKSDAGRLYANPFHKALAWGFGDSKAWAASLSEFVKSIKELGKATSSNPLVSFVRAVFDSSSADARAAVRNAGNSKTAQFVIDQFHNEAGSGRATGEVYSEAVNAKVNSRLVELHSLLGDQVHNDGAMQQLANLVRSGAARAGTKMGDAAIAIRKMLDGELNYLRSAGVELGEVKAGYFPREYVAEKIVKHGQRFIDAATQAYVETGMTRANAMLAAKELHDSLVYGEHGNIFKSQGGSGQAPFLKGRTFGKAVDNPSHPLNEFLNHSTAEVLTQYFQRSAKRAEIARRFGDNFSHWRDHKDAKGKKQDGLLTRIENEGGQGALTKLQEYVSLAAGIRAYGIGPGGMRTASIMRTWGALSFLEKATLSSLTEFIVPAMRSGNVLDAGRALVHILNDLTLKTKDAKMRRAIAEDLGLIAGHIDSTLSAARFAGGEPVGKIESKVLDKFFKRTGLTQWTDATRVGATDVARVFIRRLAKENGGKLNARHLADLGVPADKVAAFNAFVNSKNDGMPGLGDMNGDMGNLYRVAVRKFVSQSVMNPSATTKPSWMSHPIGAIVGQLQSFNYAFYENVIKRNVRLAKESATGEGYTGLERAKMVMPMVISPLLIAAAYAIGEGRDALLGDPNRRKVETDKEKLLKAASRGMPIAPLDPLINYISSAKYQRGAAQSFAGPVAGVAATGLDAARDAVLNNSPKSNTQERAAAKAVWDIFIEPAVNLALYSTPVAPVSAAITQAAGSGHVREKLFVTPLAGPKKQPETSLR